LPRPLTSLGGRDQEIAAVANLIARPDVRLLTLTGAGGVGKTRLAIAVANETASVFGDGTSFVGLAHVRDPSLVPVTIARMLGVDGHGVSGLVAALGGATRLLVLDNFEHVLEAAPSVVDLLVGCPRLTILVTSRAALRVSGEREFPVPPLALPAPAASSAESIAASPAVQLYCQRAEAVDLHFHLTEENAPTVAAICGRLDGLPLAIELAAARSKVLPPALLLPRLAQRLPLLTGGPRDVPARLRTMHEAIAWSHGLLTTDEQRTFRRLAVFSGGFTLEAAEYVGGEGGEGGAGEHDGPSSGRAPSPPPPPSPPARSGTPFSPSTPSVLEAIAALLDHSLLQRHDTTGGGRFGMLETVREFALERLAEAGEEACAREAHAAHFVAFDGRLDPNRAAPGERVDDRLWSVEAELPNLRAALAHLVGLGDAGGVLRLTGWLAVFWHHRGDLAEGRQFLEWALHHAPQTPTADRARALAGLSLIVWSQGDPAAAAALAESALAIARVIDHTELTALAFHMLGLAALSEHRWDDSTASMTEALALWRVVGLDSDAAMAMRNLAAAAYESGDVRLCEHWAEEALTIFRAMGHPSGIAGALQLVATCAHRRGDARAAVAAYQEGLRLWVGTDARWAARAPGATDNAAFFPRWAGIDDRLFLLHALGDLAGIAAEFGWNDQAAMLLGAADRRQAGAGMTPRPMTRAARAATRDRARSALGEHLFQERYDAGRQLRLDEAVALALSITAPQQSLRQPWEGCRLTTRQAEVLRLLVAGRSDREIAEALFLSRRTVQDHVSRLIATLGVANRTEAAAIAVRDHLV
jgi:non-specific serine/threonine protein kinase